MSRHWWGEEDSKQTLLQCSSCGVDKPATKDFFYPRNDARKPFRSLCKVCASEKRKLYKKNNRDKTHQYYENNKDHINKKNKEWSTENRDSFLANKRQYYEDNKSTFKEYWLNRTFNMTQQDYDCMLLLQGGSCAICKEKETAVNKSGSVKRLAVDHDHQTGVIRGLLCHRCNLALGHFKDSTSILLAAISYLESQASCE